jgi:hypothetical protein
MLDEIETLSRHHDTEKPDPAKNPNITHRGGD